MFWIEHYSEGVAAHSPGLVAERATLGLGRNDRIYPDGVGPFVVQVDIVPINTTLAVQTLVPRSVIKERFLANASGYQKPPKKCFTALPVGVVPGG